MSTDTFFSLEIFFIDVFSASNFESLPIFVLLLMAKIYRDML